MVAKVPQVARTRDRVDRGLAWTWVLDETTPALVQGTNQVLDLLGREADSLQGALCTQGPEEFGQSRLVPLGEFRRAIEGDRERRRLDLAQVELDHVALAPAKLLHRGKTTVAADDPSRRLVHDQ